MDFVLKYEPKDLDDLIGYNDQIHEIKAIYSKNPYKTVLLYGSSGCGKTTLVKTIFKSLDFSFKFYDTVTNNNKNIINEMVNLNHCNIMNLLKESKSHKKYALIIDNMDHINLTNDKTLIDNIITYNIEKEKFPLVLIINSSNLKSISDNISQKVLNIKISLPSKPDLIRFIDKICEAEGKKIVDKAGYMTIIHAAQSDIRRLLWILQDLVKHPEPTLNDIMIKQKIQYIEPKKIEKNLFESYKELVFKHDNISNVISIYNTDKVLLPLTLHENYVKDIFSRKRTNKQRIQLLADISFLVSKGDLIETDIYAEQNWLLQDTHCFFSMYKPLTLLNKKNSYKKDSDIKYDIGFSTELNKTSLKNINRKNYNNLYQHIKLSLNHTLDLSNIVNYLLHNERFNDLKTLLELYSVDRIKIIEILSKIDKCNPKIFLLNTKIKKMFL